MDKVHRINYKLFVYSGARAHEARARANVARSGAFSKTTII